METKRFDIVSMDMDNAGSVSSFIKKRLQALEIDRGIIKRVSIGSYEAEINVAIHSYGGYCEYNIDGDDLEIQFKDTGPGIPDLEKAMTAGWSTATRVEHELGFGAGMGFPNMKKAADELIVNTSEKGTEVILKFKLK